MPYNNPTPHEIRLGRNLQKIASKLQKLFLKHTGGEVDFILIVNSASARKQQTATGEAPVGNYVANMSRVSSALSMAEMLVKWQINGDIPPIKELKDAAGNSLKDIIGLGDLEMHDNDDGKEGFH